MRYLYTEDHIIDFRALNCFLLAVPFAAGVQIRLSVGERWAGAAASQGWSGQGQVIRDGAASRRCKARAQMLQRHLIFGCLRNA